MLLSARRVNLLSKLCRPSRFVVLVAFRLEVNEYGSCLLRNELTALRSPMMLGPLLAQTLGDEDAKKLIEQLQASPELSRELANALSSSPRSEPSQVIWHLVILIVAGAFGGFIGALDPKAEGLRFLRGRTDPYADLAAALVRAGEHAGEAAVQEIFEVIEAAHARALRHTLSSRPGSGDPRGARRGN